MSADRGAVPHGLYQAASLCLDPGETLRWVGRGTRPATLRALLPILVLQSVMLGIFSWFLFTLDTWEFDWVPPAFMAALSPDHVARGLGWLLLAIILFFLVMVARRVAGTPRHLVIVTDRRLILAWSRNPVSFPLEALEYVEATGPKHHPSLAWSIVETPDGKRRRPHLFGVANADAAFEELAALGIGIEDTRDEPDEEVPEPLALGESVRWSARRGWRAVGKDRLILVALAAPMTLPFFLCVWWVWTSGMAYGPSGGLAIAAATFMTLIIAMVFGPMAWFVLRAAFPFFDDMVVDMFGTLVVTDRRILFVKPFSGTIDRHIRAETLTSVDLVEIAPSGRGQITLTLENGEGGEPTFVDLLAVPDPDAAAAAMTRLVRR